MKKIILTIMMLNICSASIASSLAVSAARPTAQAARRNIAQRSASRSMATETNNTVKPYSRKAEVRAQEQAARDAAAKDTLEREQQIIDMNEAFAKHPEYSNASSMVAYSTKPSALTAPKISHLGKNNVANQEAALKVSQLAETSAILNNFEKFDKAYLAGSIASTLALFGYDAMKNKEAQASTSVAISPSVVEDIKVPLAPEQPASNFLEFVKKHGYENPRNAMLSLYTNPSSQAFLNTVSDPVIGGTLVTSVFGSYMYYQYLQSLEKQAKLEKEESEKNKK